MLSKLLLARVDGEVYNLSNVVDLRKQWSAVYHQESFLPFKQNKKILKPKVKFVQEFIRKSKN